MGRGGGGGGVWQRWPYVTLIRLIYVRIQSGGQEARTPSEKSQIYSVS